MNGTFSNQEYLPQVSAIKVQLVLDQVKVPVIAWTDASSIEKMTDVVQSNQLSPFMTPVQVV
jgi:imidazole glycerol phosphate synthase subunit HisF